MSNRSLKMARIVDPVLVEDERLGERGDLQRAMPIGRVARQPRDLQAHHEADPAQAYLGEEPLKSRALCRRRAGPSEIFTDHDDLVRGSAEGRGRVAADRTAGRYSPGA